MLTSVRRAFKPREGKGKSEPLENNGVHEKEGFFRIRAIVNTHGNTFSTRQNLQVHIEFLPEDMELVMRFALFVHVDVLEVFHLGSFG